MHAVASELRTSVWMLNATYMSIELTLQLILLTEIVKDMKSKHIAKPFLPKRFMIQLLFVPTSIHFVV